MAHKQHSHNYQTGPQEGDKVIVKVGSQHRQYGKLRRPFQSVWLEGIYHQSESGTIMYIEINPAEYCHYPHSKHGDFDILVDYSKESPFRDAIVIRKVSK